MMCAGRCEADVDVEKHANIPLIKMLLYHLKHPLQENADTPLAELPLSPQASSPKEPWDDAWRPYRWF